MGVKILDLDNCISDDAWRVSLIDWHYADLDLRYKRYHTLCGWDGFRNQELASGNEDLVIFTARPIAFREETVRWLERNEIGVAFLIMRNNNDHRPSVELKRQQLRWLTDPNMYGVIRREIVHAYDDRPEIVAMYQSEGIPASVRSIHQLPYREYNAR